MGKKILCIDDSSTIRMLVKKTLDPLGYEIGEADDGTSGVEASLKGGVELFIVDVNMPQMNGFECVEKIKTNPSYAKTPIIFLTTESSAEKKEQGKKLGVSGWMVKPFEPEALVKIVKMLVG